MCCRAAERCLRRLQVQDLICKFSKKGLTPSQIGVLLRDNHGIAQVSTVTGSKVLRILKGQGARYAPRQHRRTQQASAAQATFARRLAFARAAVVCARVC